jgi:hypothetical protein
MKLTTHLQLEMRSRQCGATHPLPICHHGVVLNYLRTGTTLPYFTCISILNQWDAIFAYQPHKIWVHWTCNITKQLSMYWCLWNFWNNKWNNTIIRQKETGLYKVTELHTSIQNCSVSYKKISKSLTAELKCLRSEKIMSQDMRKEMNIHS